MLKSREHTIHNCKNKGGIYLIKYGVILVFKDCFNNTNVDSVLTLCDTYEQAEQLMHDCMQEELESLLEDSANYYIDNNTIKLGDGTDEETMISEYFIISFGG